MEEGFHDKLAKYNVYTLSVRRSKKKLRVYTASEAKGLKTMLFIFDVIIIIHKKYLDLNWYSCIAASQCNTEGP